MHGLRKDRPAHRRLRPGILKALAGAVLLAACTPRVQAPANEPFPGAAWFQLAAGAFQSVTGPAAGPAVAMRPWTVQARVADMAFLDSTLYCAVNGFGLAEVGRDGTGALSFLPHFDAMIFGHRTVTTLVPRQSALTVHLYYNALLNDIPAAELPLEGISLVTWLPGLSDYEFLIPPFQRKSPEWEAVGFAPESENSFDMEWKRTDAVETRFAWTRFHADTRAEEPTDRDTYLAALGVPSVSGPAVPTDLALFFAACRAALPGVPPGSSLQFSLRSRENPLRKNYRSLSESESAVQVPVFQADAARYALLPNATLLWAGADGVPHSERLPLAPRGVRYTDLAALGDSLLIAWEESSFTEVGRAGILAVPLPR